MFEKHILKQFATSVSRFPDRNAFCINETFYTYAEFGRLCAQIRTQLRKHPVENGRIGIVVHDDIYAYASIFAVWMEGKAYVPLHPKHPTQRNLDVIEQARLQLVLDSGAEPVFKSESEPMLESLPTVAPDSFMIIDTKKSGSLRPTSEEVSVSDNALAYILFTSGSTGKPKGVPISRGNLAAFFKVFPGYGISIDENDRCLQSFDLTFDISVQCYLYPLMRGACIYTIPHDQIKFTYVYGLLDDHELTFAVMAPSMVHHLRPYFQEILLEKLRYFLVAAEATPTDLLDEWFPHIPNARVFNFYGPTEATIYCVSYEAKRDSEHKAANGLLAIGRPFEGIDAVVLDDTMQIAEKGIKGELYVSGKQVTVGYWENPEKNAESFLALQYKGEQQRFYKTGDLCMIDDDGDILYYGRSDYQIKIQGYRIELGEIEFHARLANGGRNAVAFVYDGEGGRKQIALCLESKRLNEKQVVSLLSAKLPAYMLPAKLFQIEKFPLNTSDKIDRKKIATLLPV